MSREVDWIGELPEGWTVEKLKYGIDMVDSGGTPTATNESFYSDEGVCFVNIADLSTVDFITDTKKHLTATGVDNKNLNIHIVGTILYSIYATLGKVAELQTEATISQAILALRETVSKYNHNYFKYALHAIERPARFLSSGTTQQNFSKELVLNFEVPLPPLPEQQAIADYLDAETAKIDELIAKQQRMLELLEEKRKAVITAAVTGKMPEIFLNVTSESAENERERESSTEFGKTSSTSHQALNGSATSQSTGGSRG